MEPASAARNDDARYIEIGTPAFRRTNLGMFAAGFSTYALLYCVQPLMPVFSREFHVGAAESSLAVSLTTSLLAVALLFAGSLSEAWGRKPVMVVSLFAAAVLTVALAFLTSWNQLLVVRALEGIAFSGLPAVAMAYLSEEMHKKALGLAMGLYLGGAGLGGMTGRLGTGVLTDLLSWRFACGAVGVFGIVAALIFWRSLPPSVHFHPMPLATRGLLTSFLDHLRDPGLLWLFAEGFLVMGCFVTVYNYISYRLLAPPYNLSQSAVGGIFAVYLAGIAGSALVGDLGGRFGRRNVLWMATGVMLAGLLLTLASGLVVIVAGMAVLTFGFFGAHSVVASWVGLRAQRARAQAASLYMFFFYMGASIIGSCGGFFWSAARWNGVAAFVGGLLVLALLIALRLIRLPPRAAEPEVAPIAVALD